MDWFTADTHFFHKNIIQYCGRPWATVDEMTLGLIERWNKRVRDEDRVFVLGDFSLGNRNAIGNIVSQLRGKKILVRGNHDSYKSPLYVEAGFHSVSPLPMLYEEKYLLSHMPVVPLTPGLINIHGHLHNQVNPNYWAPNHICVSVEMTDYAPVKLKEILAMLERKNNLCLDRQMEKVFCAMDDEKEEVIEITDEV